jgi:Kef-type K+ transport system membrane component KefB
VWEIVGAILVGGLLSLFVIAYLRYYNKNLILFILAICVLSIQLAHFLHIEAVITPLTMGFCVRNFSKEGRRLLIAIGKSKKPIYVIFFAITGASLRLDFLLNNWWIVILLVLMIRFFIWGSFWVGLRLTKMPENLKKYCHYGFIGQACVTLGFATIIERTFVNMGYEQMGSDLRGIIVAIVVVHQLVGPPLFYRALTKAGESKEQRMQAEIAATHEKAIEAT